MKHAPLPRRRYLALFLPFLPAERWLKAQNGPPPDAPLVFVEKAKNALRIVAADPNADALGLTPGLALADARARVPDLCAVDHDPAGDDRFMDALADWCDRYTPMVALDPPYGLILDLTGCAASAGEIAKDITDHALTVHGVEAETPDRARALSRFGAGLPIAALEIEADPIKALRRAGLVSIADLAARPRAILAARFGEGMTAKLARILGEEDVHITPRRPPPALFVTRRFAEPVAQTDYVLTMLDACLGEAAEALEQRGAGGRAFVARLYRSDGAVHQLRVATGAPTRDPARVMRLFRERIDTLSDPLDPGFGYDALRLDVPVADPLGKAQLRLDGGAAPDAETGPLLERIGVRLGAERVRRFVPGNSHVPELASCSAPYGLAGVRRAPYPLRTDDGEPPLRPLYLFHPPQPIEVMAEVPDGPPRRFRWRRTMHDIARFEGPERIAAEWWKRRDMAGLTRDYYRVEDDAGRRFWVFRHGLYGRERANPNWYLHGMFA